MQSFTKKISKRKGKYSGEIVLYPVNIDEHCSWNLIMHAYFFRCMQIFFRRRQTVWRHSYFVCALLPDNSTDTFTEIYKHIKYMFGSNSHGLAPERGLRPDKFINLATLGPSALASRGTKFESPRKSSLRRFFFKNTFLTLCGINDIKMIYGTNRFVGRVMSCDNAQRTLNSHAPNRAPPCFYHVLTLSVRYQSTDARPIESICKMLLGIPIQLVQYVRTICKKGLEEISFRLH